MIQKVEITQGDIDKGERNVCCHCPTARALFRATGVVWRVLYTFAVQVEDPFKASIIFSNEVSEWITNFDHRLPVSPVTFEVEIP